MIERSFLAELKRRNVIRVAIAYVAVSWLVLQAGALIFQAMDVPNSFLRGMLAVLVVGFIPAMVFSWVYELTPEGLKREAEIERDESITHLTGRRLDYLVIGVMAAVIGLLLVDKFVLTPRKVEKGSEPFSAIATSQTATTASGEKGSDPFSTPEPAQATIAVLPFVDMSQGKDQEYFSDGISEELLNLLAKIPQLQVTARTSSFSFKGKDIPIPEIAKTLKVAHILEGSVRKAGDQVRVTAQLINAVNDKHLWSQTYDRKLDDVFAIQDEIAADVVKALRVTLLGELPKATTTNPEAYALYLQGNELAKPATPEALAASDAVYRRAVEIDPKYMPAWDGLTRNAINRVPTATSLQETERLIIEARRAADQALALDPGYARTHGRLGSIAMFTGDLRGAVPHFQHALSLDPNDIIVLSNATSLLSRLGRVDQSLRVREALLRRDPVNVTGLLALAAGQRVVGRYDESIATIRTALSLAPTRRGARDSLGRSLLLKGDAQGALAEFEQEPDERQKLESLALAYHALGRKVESDAALAALIAKYEEYWSYQIAGVHAFRGDADEAFAWLDKADERKDPGLYEIQLDPLLARIKSDPRWLPFLRRIGRAPEQLAQIEFDVKIPPSIDDAATRDAQPAKP